jgi:hypothetical protein
MSWSQHDSVLDSLQSLHCLSRWALAGSALSQPLCQCSGLALRLDECDSSSTGRRRGLSCFCDDLPIQNHLPALLEVAAPQRRPASPSGFRQRAARAFEQRRAFRTCRSQCWPPRASNGLGTIRTNTRTTTLSSKRFHLPSA